MKSVESPEYELPVITPDQSVINEIHNRLDRWVSVDHSIAQTTIIVDMLTETTSVIYHR